MTQTGLQNLTEKPRFSWTKQKEKAAQLLALDKASDEEIATQVGVTRQSIATWKLSPDFQVRVESLVAAYRAAIRRRGIAIVENRVDALQHRWEKMKTVITERGASEEMQDVPGGRTGLLVKTVKSVGSGDSWEMVELYAVDTGLLKSMLDHELQAAKELGQLTNKTEITGIVKAYEEFAMDEV